MSDEGWDQITDKIVSYLENNNNNTHKAIGNNNNGR